MGTKYQTHCKFGHEFTEENTERVQCGKYKVRRCKECHRNQERDRYRLYDEKTKQIIIDRAANRNKVHKNSRNLLNRCRNYGLTIDEYNAMEKAQNFSCAICNEQLPLRIDHDHITGKVRKLLCHNCNVMLGHAFERPDVLRKGAEYLEVHNVAPENGIRPFQNLS